MASDVTDNNGEVVWKYQTPLKAKYLNTLISGMTSPGLLSRPNFSGEVTNGIANLTIGPFTALVPFSNTSTGASSDNRRAIKVTTDQNLEISCPVETGVLDNPIGLGLKYVFDETGGENKASLVWIYSNNTTLSNVTKVSDIGELGTTSTIVIGNVLIPENRTRIYVSSYGADVSNSLLIDEGWDLDNMVMPIGVRGFANQSSNNFYLWYSEWVWGNKKISHVDGTDTIPWGDSHLFNFSLSYATQYSVGIRKHANYVSSFELISYNVSYTSNANIEPIFTFGTNSFMPDAVKYPQAIVKLTPVRLNKINATMTYSGTHRTLTIF
ncbi:MAG: hypothetical protein J6Y78_09780 [Paludibacteraceae bacterium]|nr:hypothetical protein [Paludibacteraceae bacterium]